MSSCVEATCRGLQAAPDEQVRQALASWLSENRPTAGFRDFISNQAEVRTTPFKEAPATRISLSENRSIILESFENPGLCCGRNGPSAR